MTKNQSSDYDSLFREYLRICNEGLHANKGCYPYPRVMREMEDRLRSHPIQVAIYDQYQDQPEIRYEMVMDGECLAFRAPRKKVQAKHPWLISKHYLEEVTQHPPIYIGNPAQLDWTWLTCPDVGV